MLNQPDPARLESAPTITLIALVLAMIGIVPASAQRMASLSDEQTIVAEAKSELQAALAPGGALHERVIEEQLIGRYTIQLSLREKGDVSSIFVMSAEEGDIRSQNRFKDLLHEFRFHFKMPKGKQYRMEIPFDLNTILR